MEKVCKGKCPKCGGENLIFEAGEEVWDENYENAEFPFYCDDCGCTGVEKCVLVYKHTDYTDEDGEENHEYV